jgi:transposase-like protein
MKSKHGEFELDVPRDRNGSFEPEIVKKNQRTMTGEIEERILSLYALDNSYTQKASTIEDIYGVGFSTDLSNHDVKDPKKVYQAFTKEEAEMELDKLEEKWDNLSVFFKYPADIRKVIYTTKKPFKIPYQSFYRYVFSISLCQQYY